LEFHFPAVSRRSGFDFPIVGKERTWKILDVMALISKSHGCGAARVSLAWLLAKPFVTSIIIGAKRLDRRAHAGIRLAQSPIWRKIESGFKLRQGQ